MVKRRLEAVSTPTVRREMTLQGIAALCRAPVAKAGNDGFLTGKRIF